jgi:drug/metabolite transporter (DMT)-like permease
LPYFKKKNNTHIIAVIEALLVTFLWSTSWILIKFGLKKIPALTFAGLRYTIAFLCLLPFCFFSKKIKSEITGLKIPDIQKIILLGILYYAITQGTQFVGLKYLPAIAVTLILTFTTILVAVLGIIFLKEKPTHIQWLGIVISTIGSIAYFYPVTISGDQLFGIFIVIFGMIANASSSVLGRDINKKGNLHPVTVTILSMGFGSIILLLAGIIIQGIPPLSYKSWLIIIWLALVNTAFAFTLWNNTLRTLTAAESSIINNTMLIQIAILAWVFLGESLNLKTITGLLLVAAGTIAVSIKRKN